MNQQLIDRIKPGEFTFCSRCGKNVHYGDKDFMCFRCCVGGELSLLSRTTASKKQRQEDRLRVIYEEKISRLIREHRQKLAELRLESTE